MPKESRISIQFLVWLAIYVAVLAWSAVRPADTLTWWLETFPTFIGVTVMAITYKRFPLTPLLCWIILVHSIILFVGAHYTYAEVPFPNLFGDLFTQGRNNFDKIGHFFQGVTPALIARELLCRTTPLGPSKWTGFLCVSVALAFSAFYEFIEWWTSLVAGTAGDAFLGMQGYVWDTQSDMFMALIGSTLAMLCLSRWQTAQMRSRGWLKY